MSDPAGPTGTEGTVRVAGPDSDIVVHRDEYGIPHVRAETTHDAFFGQGFVQAQDRLGQLEYDRRRAHGRWAEVAGPSRVASDVFARRCGLRHAARAEYEALDPGTRAVLDAFAAGVNAWIATEPALPPDLEAASVRPEPWRPWDCCAVFLGRHVVFANWQLKLWRGRAVAALGAEIVARLHSEGADGLALIVPPGAPAGHPEHDASDLDAVAAACEAFAGGSNSWALHGRRTASGKPLVAGDPHRLLEVPNVYYQCHLAGPEFDAVGLAFVGVPGLPHFGHNERVAWCVTNANGDYQDLFVERFDPAHPQRYRFRDEWLEADRRREVVSVAGHDSVEVDVLVTRHGPVVLGDPATGVALALRTTALAEPSTGLRALLPMLRAGSVDELEAAMADWVDPCNNLVSADVDGTIAYHTVGRIPVRSPANAWGPVPGWTGEHEWEGVVRHDELPALRNPGCGYIVTANQRIAGPEYPHRLGLDYAPPHRARRILEHVEAARGATVDDMAAIHRDRIALASGAWVSRLLDVAPADALEAAALERLRAWDGEMAGDSVAATVYMATRDGVCRIVARDPRIVDLRAPFPGEPPAAFVPLTIRLWGLLPPLLVADDPTLLPEGRAWPDVLAQAFHGAVRWLRAELGDDVDTWRWERLHVAAPSHPLAQARPELAAVLDPPPVAVSGEWDTVHQTLTAPGLSYAVTVASVARYAFDLGDWERSRWVVPLGVSGDARSPHFADQQVPWAEGRLVPMRYDWGGIAAAAESSLSVFPSATGR